MSDTGFIGTGTIGAPIAAHLITDPGALRIFDTNEDAMQALVDQGAKRASSVRELAAECSTVFLSLPGPVQIEDVVLGNGGLLAHKGALTTIVDLSTNSIALNREISARAQAVRVHYLDAPVSGGKAGARDGSLAIMVGGDETAFTRVRPLLERFGSNIFYLGPAGSGTMAKLINNQLFLAASVLVQEGFVMGAKAGMDPNTLSEVLKASSAAALMRIAPMALSRKFDLGVFALSIAAKDIAIATESADALGAEVPLAKAASAIYERAIADGYGQEDFYATLKVFETSADVVTPPLEKAAKAGR
jgi:3-hydroxyisobutyrate dehydrogenase-like beta-hydroxyacid dehydrogenase